MKKYHEIKTKHEEAISTLLEKYQVFFAFSKEQLEAGKAKINITDNKDLADIGAGGFMPKINTDKFFTDMADADKNFKKELKEAKQAQEGAILYELNNHESFYRGSMDDVFSLFEDIYTKDEIKAVYKKYCNQEKKFIDKSND